MTWDGTERRNESITVSDVKNAVYEANEKFFEKVKKNIQYTNLPYQNGSRQPQCG